MMMQDDNTSFTDADFAVLGSITSSSDEGRPQSTPEQAPEATEQAVEPTVESVVDPVEEDPLSVVNKALLSDPSLREQMLQQGYNQPQPQYAPPPQQPVAQHPQMADTQVVLSLAAHRLGLQSLEDFSTLEPSHLAALMQAQQDVTLHNQQIVQEQEQAKQYQVERVNEAKSFVIDSVAKQLTGFEELAKAKTPESAAVLHALDTAMMNTLQTVYGQYPKEVWMNPAVLSDCLNRVMKDFKPFYQKVTGTTQAVAKPPLHALQTGVTGHTDGTQVNALLNKVTRHSGDRELSQALSLALNSK